ncbi:MAG: hypothetical protein CO109_10120, partial [Deltaproteobacteria bacterium CG_4_9_14_3_um_filter_65_9]
MTLAANVAAAETLTIAVTNADVAGTALLDINVDDAVTLDSSAAGLSFDGVTDSNFTVTGSGQSLTLAAAGGGAQSVFVTSAGTGVNAVDISATAGGFSIDGANTTSNITLTGDGAGDDLTVGVAGAFDSSLILSSTGTGADALQITASAGGIDIAATGAAAGEDIDITATGSSINLTSTEAIADAIRIYASDAAGGADIDVGTGGFIVDQAGATGGISLDAATSSNYTVTGSGMNLTLASAGGGAQSVILNSAGTGVNAIDLEATAGGFSIDGVISSNLSMNANVASAETLTISATNADGAGTALLDINVDDAITMDSSAAGIAFNAAAASSFATAAGNLTFSSGATVDIDGTTSVTVENWTFN